MRHSGSSGPGWRLRVPGPMATRPFFGDPSVPIGTSGVPLEEPRGNPKGDSLKRIVIIGTALAVLVGAAAALAANFNNYNGSKLAFAPKGAGTAKAPKIVSMTETLQANA